MKRFNVEFFVGLFVLAGILSIGYLTIKLGKLNVFSGNTYLVSAQFSNVSGLTTGARIEVSGVEVGSVKSISLNNTDQVAVLTLQINAGIVLTDDVIASVKISGLIGDKYIKLTLGGSDTVLGDGDIIEETESVVDLEELISKYVFGGV